MARLLKYEFRKTMFPKLILLALALFLEALFLIGILLREGMESPLTSVGIAGLMLSSVIGISFIGLYSLMVLYRDMSTKQGYMLFMTPYNSFTILGAKVLENALSLSLAGAFFAGLALLDIRIVMQKLGETMNYKAIFQMIMNSLDIEIELTPELFFAGVFAVICGWLMFLMTAGLAMILALTLLSGKKGSAILSFVFFLLINWGTSWLQNQIPAVDFSMTAVLMFWGGVNLAFTVVFYLVSGWMMEKKLSL